MSSTRPRRALVAIASFVLAARAAYAFDSVDDDRPWAVVGVTVVDVRSGGLRPDQTVLVRAGRIVAVGPASAVRLPEGTIVVEERGRFAIPGLWDMHVHFRGGPKLEAANERWLGQYLGFGVTSVRDAGGDLPDAVLRWKRAIARGELQGPRIFTSIRKIDGPDAGWEGSIAVSSPADADRALDELERAGADFIKVYDGSIEPQAYLDVLAAAERRGLRTAGHIPLSLPFEDAIAAGLDSVEHSFHLLKAANPSDREASRRFATEGIPLEFEPYFVAVTKLGDDANEARARAMFRAMAARGTALTPTLYIREAWDRIDGAEDDGTRDARLAAVPDEIRETYFPALDVFVSRSEEELASDRRLEKLSARFTRWAAEEGVTILAGSDTGAANPSAYPGDALQNELAALVGAGLTPLQALRAATLEPARWFGRSDELGALEPHMAADFVILARNPLADISATRSIVAVVQQGVFFDATELEALKTLRDAD